MTTTRTSPRRPRARRVALAASAVVLLAGGATAVALALPAWVKGRFIDACAAEGVTATVDDVVLSFTALHFRDVTMTSSALPQVRVHSRDLTVALDGSTPTSAALTDVDVL